ncbi:pectate lyase family protein [Campylobacter concisus]
MADLRRNCARDSAAITISHNIFENHDKTMLIGSRDYDGSSETRTITVAHNIFDNCAQRLPMARNAKVHVYNNFYDSKDGFYDQNTLLACVWLANIRPKQLLCKRC